MAVAIALVACELFARLVSARDAEGQMRVAGIAVPPVRIGLRAIADNIERYRSSASPFLVYDPDLGWAPRPGATSRDGRAHVDGHGARVTGASPSGNADGARVELFGDSFTFGDESTDEETWGALLEQRLRAGGFDVDVLNFGVNAYGLDQAYLRWRKAGRAMRPAVVVLGLQPENAFRDLNVFRPLYFGNTEVPLSKPRFLLDGDSLRLINSPALPPEEVVGALARFPEHPLALHERFFDAGRANAAWWQKSRLLALAAALLDRERPDAADASLAALASDPEVTGIARRLLARFAAEVADSGAAFLVVYLPRKQEFDEARARGTSWDAGLVAAITAGEAVVRPDGGFAPLGDGDFQPGGHYGRRLNAIVAEALAAPVGAALCEQVPSASPRCAH